MSWWRPSPEKRFRRDKYADWFVCLDRNDNGVLDAADFAAYAGAITERLGLAEDHAALGRLHAATKKLWATLVGTMDEAGAGSIRLDELVGALVTAEHETREAGAVPAWARDYVMCTFAVLDVDGDGTISKDEYAAYLATLDNEGDAADVFAKLDTNGDGVLSLEEIEAHFTDWLTSGDPEAPDNLLLTGQLPR